VVVEENHGDRYGLQFGQPDWLPELITRYHLTPLPGA
jgi:hypothetical protein